MALHPDLVKAMENVVQKHDRLLESQQELSTQTEAFEFKVAPLRKKVAHDQQILDAAIADMDEQLQKARAA